MDNTSPTCTDARQFITLIRQLMASPTFERLSRYNQHRHWLETLTFKEDTHSRILAWLLDPNEGHNLGDFFLKRLMGAVNANALSNQKSPTAQRFQARIDQACWFPAERLYPRSFHTALVSREVPTLNDSHNDRRRIDLLVVDPVTKTVICIERKDGSVVSRGQLTHYQRWVETCYPGFFHLFVLSDSQERNYLLSENSDWIQMNDSWLVEALKDALSDKLLPAVMQTRFQELLCHFEEIDTDGEDYFSDFDAELNEFVHLHRDTILRLCQNPLLSLAPRHALAAELPDALGRNDDDTVQALTIAARYHILLGDLTSRATLNTLCDSLERRYPGEQLALVAEDDYIAVGTPRMVEELARGESDDWPIYIQLNIPLRDVEQQAAEDEDATLTPAQLWLFMDLKHLGKRHDSDTLEAVARQHDLTLYPRYAKRFIDFETEEDAMEIGRLHAWVDEMLRLARRFGY